MFRKDLPLAALDSHYNSLHAAHAAEDPHSDDNSGIRHVFDSHIRGYTGKITEQVLQRIRETPEVLCRARPDCQDPRGRTLAPWVR